MLKHGVWRTGGLIYTQPHPPLCPIPSQNLSFHRKWRPTHPGMTNLTNLTSYTKMTRITKKIILTTEELCFVETQVLMTSTGQEEFPLLERVRSLFFCFLQHVI